MKRWMLMLALALLLTGCAAPDQTPTDTTPPTTAEPTQPLPQSTWVETLDQKYSAVAPWGNDLLLFAEECLTLYRDGAVAARLKAGIPLPDSGGLRLLEESICYFDAAANALVTLDRELQETARISLTDSVTGAVCLSPDARQLFYCDSTGVRLWDAETRIHRTLKQMEGDWLGVTGSIRQGAYLICSLRREDDTIRSMLVSAETGETVYEAPELAQLTDSGDFYCCPTDREWIFGWYGQQPQNLLVDSAFALPQIQAAVSVTIDGGASDLALYDLKTGLKVARDHVETTGLTAPVLWQNKLVFLAGDRLCFWDHAISPLLRPVVDETVYTAYRYTAEAPDHEGLAALRERAEALETQYGIDILMYQDVLDAQPAGYVFSVEHQTGVYEKAFATLEKALARFPKNFFKKAASWTDDGTLHIVLARSITAPATQCGSQYLLGWNAYLPLRMDDTLEQTFYHGLGHVIDTLVLSKSHGFYEWHTVNPSGFEYDNNYDSWQDRKSKYLEGSTRCFVNSFSMTFPVEDRATLLEYAMLPGNEAVFESKYMQAKLNRLKVGLREAFSLTGKSYPWEKYLKK